MFKIYFKCEIKEKEDILVNLSPRLLSLSLTLLKQSSITLLGRYGAELLELSTSQFVLQRLNTAVHQLRHAGQIQLMCPERVNVVERGTQSPAGLHVVDFPGQLKLFVLRETQFLQQH